MPRFHRQRLVAADNAEKRHIRCLKAFADQRHVPLRGDAVDDRAGKVKSFRQLHEAAGDRRRRLRQAFCRNDEDDRQPGEARQRGGRAGAATAAVVKTHHALNDDDVAAARLSGEIGGNGVLSHRPGIEIDRIAAAGRRQEPRIDIVRPAFRRRHLQPARP